MRCMIFRTVSISYVLGYSSTFSILRDFLSPPSFPPQMNLSHECGCRFTSSFLRHFTPSDDKIMASSWHLSDGLPTSWAVRVWSLKLEKSSTVAYFEFIIKNNVQCLEKPSQNPNWFQQIMQMVLRCCCGGMIVLMLLLDDDDECD